MSRFGQRARAGYADLGALLCLALVHAKLCYGIDRATDLNAWDEGHYLRLGVELLQRAAPVDGLFYYAWYWLLHHVIVDPVALYVSNNGLLLGVPAYLLYGLLRRLGHDPGIALIAAGLFLISPANVVTWPYITRFALCLVLLCALMLTLPLENTARAACVLVASFVLGYVRPEYMALFAVSVLVALCVMAMALRAAPLSAAWLGGLVAGLLALTLALGSPYSLSRSRVAFSQHFAFQQARSGAPRGFSAWHNADQIMRQHFGKSAVSLGEALAIQPRAVLAHVLANARTAARAVSTQLLPYQGRLSDTQTGLVQLTLAFLGLSWLRHLRRRALQASDWVWAFLACHALVGAGSALLLYPRDHYLLIPFCVGFAWAAALVRAALPAPAPPLPWLRAGVSVASALGLLWLAPFQLSGPNGMVPRAPRDVLAPGTPSLRNRMQQIARLPTRRPLQLLSAYPELPVFMPGRLQPSQPLLDGVGSFDTLLEHAQIELVWLDEELERANRFAGDVSLARFAQDPERYGFSAYATGIPDERLYVRQGVLRD